ncbi:MAG: c-type cytochrome [Thermoanaerobaculia bacterium]
MAGPKRVLVRLLGWAGVAALAGGALYAGWIGAISEWKRLRRHDVPLVALRSSRPPDLVEGKRMARIVGCWDGCHGRTGGGGTEEILGILQASAPPLGSVVPLYTDEELARLVREGVKRDGRSAVGMISYTFWALGDQDLVDIFAHLRAQPAVPAVERRMDLTWEGRKALVSGRWGVSADLVDRSRPRWGDLPQRTPFERGRYLASVTCSECHGLDFHGNPLERAPSLALLGSYSPEDFHHLIRTAEAPGPRRLDEAMSWVADAPFTDAEVDALYQFLRGHFGFPEWHAPQPAPPPG